MHLIELELRGFRNYRQEVFRFDQGVNLIVGSNAQGKTNLLEAIGFLGSGKSFRTQKNGEMVRFDGEFGEITGQVSSQGREQNIRWLLFPGRPRQLWRNGAKKKSAADITGVLPSVLFCPEDLMILKGSAAPRRKLIDTALCQLRPGYAQALAEYTKLYESKSRILKDYHENPSLLEPLPEFNTRLAQVGAILIAHRARYLRALSEAAGAYHSEFSGGKEHLTLEYHTVSTVTDPFAEKKVLFSQILDHQQSHYRAELESGQCLTGPHKDDFDARLGEMPVKSFGSQGQIRTAAISLKLAERELLRRDMGEEPVLLLDDVLSELDAMRQDFVLNQIKSGQVFITCCEPGRVSQLGQSIVVENGSIL